jgi:hypothetical protein
VGSHISRISQLLGFNLVLETTVSFLKRFVIAIKFDKKTQAFIFLLNFAGQHDQGRTSRYHDLNRRAASYW